MEGLIIILIIGSIVSGINLRNVYLNRNMNIRDKIIFLIIHFFICFITGYYIGTFLG